MEDALQPLEAVEEQMKPNKNLVLGLAASVLLHLVSAFVLIGLPAGPSAPPPSITYIDLNAAQHPAPMTAPPKQLPPPEVVRELQPQPAPVPVPESPPQVRQPEALPAQPAPPQPQNKVEEQRSHTTMGLGLTKGYFKSLGEGESLREGVKGYYLEMLQVINEKWWMDEQIDKRHVAPVVVSITVARNGAIIDAYIMVSSGSPRYDKAVLAALAGASPLPPLPDSYDAEVFQAPIRLVPPLNLMAW